jgi:hypothetical protein
MACICAIQRSHKLTISTLGVGHTCRLQFFLCNECPMRPSWGAAVAKKLAARMHRYIRGNIQQQPLDAEAILCRRDAFVNNSTHGNLCGCCLDQYVRTTCSPSGCEERAQSLQRSAMHVGGAVQANPPNDCVHTNPLRWTALSQRVMRATSMN